MIGDSAGFNHTTGASNVFIGDNAGYTNTSGEGNVFIGNYAGVYVPGGATASYSTSNRLQIANGKNILIQGSFTDKEVRICDKLTTKTLLPSSTSGSYLGNSDYRWSYLYAGAADFKGNVTPSATNTYTIGSSSYRWKNIYANAANFEGNVVPNTDKAYTLGEYSKRWKDIYSGMIHLREFSSSSNPSTTDFCAFTSDIQTYLTANYTQTGVYSYARAINTEMGEYYAISGVVSYGKKAVGVKGMVSGSKNGYGGYFSNSGTGTNNYGIYVEGDTDNSNWAAYIKGDLEVTKSIYGTLHESSDARLKKDVQTIERALDKVLKLRGVSYYWKNKEELNAIGANRDFDSNKHIGVIAQELEKEFPELVNNDKEGFKSVNYSGIAPILIEAVKELKAEKDELEAKVEKLEKMVEELMKKQ